MKKALLFSVLLLFSFAMQAQHCVAVSNNITPHTATGNPGFNPSPAQIPCIDSGSNVSDTLYFENYSYLSGLAVSMDYVKFDSIENLPAGLCWTTNAANNTFTSGQTGVIYISGHCTARRGQYKLRIIVDVSAQGGLFVLTNQDLETITQSYAPPAIRNYLRVKCASASCPALDTVNGANNSFIAYTTASCATGTTLTPTITASGATTFCPGDSVILTAGPSGSTYHWNTNASSQSITAKTAGTYSVTVTNGGNSAVTSMVVTTISVPTVTLAASGSGCLGSDSLTVSGATGATQIQWYRGTTLASTSTGSASGVGVTAAGGNGYTSALNDLEANYILLDAAGYLYVSDAMNNRVLKFPPGSTQSTNGTIIAGGNGAGTAANQLDFPAGIFIDASGNLYVADANNERIQKFAAGSTQSTNATTVAGGMGYGSAANQLHSPEGVYVDASQNIYVADYANSRIQKFPAGSTAGTNATTVAGDNGIQGNMWDFTVDGSGNMYVSDAINHLVRKYPPGSTSATVGTIVAGGNGSGTGANQLNAPMGVAVDAAGNLFVADHYNERIQKFPAGSTSASNATTVAGGNGSGTAANQFNGAWDVVVDAAGTIYVADVFNIRVQKFSSSVLNYSYKPTIAGSYTAVVTFPSGCKATTNAVVINTVSAPSVTTTATQAVFCAGTSTIDTFRATPVNGGTVPTYQWYRNGIAVGTGAIFVASSVANNDSIWVVMTSNSACATTPNATSTKVRITVKPSATRSISTSVCQGSSYTVGGQSFNTAGAHVVTLTGGAANGCDSTITLNLTIKQPASRSISTSVCQGSSYTVGGQSFTTAGAHVVTLTGGAANGCDSTITLNLTIKQPATKSISTSVCQGSSYTVGGQSFNTAGAHVVTLTGGAANGCDSTITLNLTIKQPATRSISTSVCQGSSYTVGGQSFNTAGAHVVTLTGGAANGCDSTITLNLTIKQPATRSISTSVCQGSSYTVGGQSFNTAGAHVVTLTGGAANGCDSTITLNLTIKQPATRSISTSVCQGSSYTVGGQSFNTAGAHIVTLTGGAANGCDSTITLNLTIKQPATKTINASICQGSSYTAGGQTFNTAGAHTVTLTGGAANGCDSTITLNLAINSFASTTLNEDICAGTTYHFHNQNLTAAGTYVDSLHAAGGCDSIVTLHLTVKSPVTSSVTAGICTGGSYTLGSQTFSSTGTYNVTWSGGAANGCDSIITLHLTVSGAIATTLSHSICWNESYQFHNQSLSTSGTYTDSLHAVGGCDSIVTLTLTVSPKPSPVASVLGSNTVSTSGTFTTYQWLFNNTVITGATGSSYVYTQNGSYRVVVTDANGCVDTSAAVSATLTGINETTANATAKLYPNPNTGSFILESTRGDEYIVSDMLGRIVSKQPVTSDKQPVSLPDAAVGSYILTVRSEYGSVRIPFVVNR